MTFCYANLLVVVTMDFCRDLISQDTAVFIYITILHYLHNVYYHILLILSTPIFWFCFLFLNRLYRVPSLFFQSKIYFI